MSMSEKKRVYKYYCRKLILQRVIMNQNIELFRTITNDYSIAQHEINKFMNWSQGKIEEALNYYYHRKQKNHKVSDNNQTNKIHSQREDAFKKMTKASQKQKKTDEFITKVREQYKLPIRGRTTSNISQKIEKTAKINQYDIDEELSEADFLPEVFKIKHQQKQCIPHNFEQNQDIQMELLNQQDHAGESSQKSEESFHEKHNNQYQQEYIQKQFNEEIEQNIQLPSNKIVQQNQTHPQFQIILDQAQLFLGEIIIFGFAIKFQNNVILAQGTPLDFRYHIEQEKKKKGSKGNNFSKKTNKNMNMRLLYNNSQFGRLKDEQVRIFLPLIVHKMVKMQITAFQIPKRLDYYTKLKLKAKVYLLKKAITKPVVETFGNKSDIITMIYQPLTQQIIALFDRLQLPIKTKPLIKRKSKIKHIKDGLAQRKQQTFIQEQEMNRKSEQQRRKRTDPFFKSVQQNLGDMLKFTSKQNSNSTSTNSKPPKQQKSAIKKRVLQLKTIEEDKCAQLVDLYEQDLQPFHPKHNFLSELYNYQALALSWMLKREGHQLTDKDKEEIHPLWTQFVLPEPKYRLFLNQLTSQISIIPPYSKNQCTGGILADEMGLGKTVMMAALIATQTEKIRKKHKGGNLIVVPLTLLSQWEAQIKKHTKNITTLLYYSLDRKKYADTLHNYDVVITTYGTISHQFAKGFGINSNQGLYKMQWERIILDEAHYIKGRIIQTAKAAYALNGLYRWCMTGTPIQNNLTDLYSLVHFIKYSPWGQFECWDKYINKPQQMGDQNVYEVLRTILKRVFLRRTKQSKDQKGNNIVELPNKISKIEILQMNQKQRLFYDGIYQNSKLKIEELDKLGILQTKYMQILEILMKLRQICCHPFLYKSITNFVTNIEKFQSALRKFIKKRQLATVKDQPQGFKQNYFEPVIQGDEQQRVSVTQTNHISQNYIQQVLQNIGNKQFQNCLICLNVVEDPVITVCLHIFCKTCAIRQIQECGICSACRRRITKEDFLHLPRQNRFNHNFEDTSYTPSTKLVALMEHLVQLKPDDKVVIFSQFLGMLDLIEHELKLNKITFVRMEGKTTHRDRTKIVNSFQTNPNIQIFVVSLKTAGVGLNLIAANKVFLMDPWWNPGVQQQAIERVHRIGQKREVEVVRFVIDKSIQMRMIELNTSKKKLSHKVLSQQGYPIGGESRVQKLKYLMEKY